MPRNHFSQVAILDREFETSAGLELADVLAIQLLPRGIVPECGLLAELVAALLDVLVAQQEVDAPILEIDFHAVAGS
jgi:hypothetical protein